MSAASDLALLRARLGLSMSEMAKLLGYAGASSYQRYEDVRIYPVLLPPAFVLDLADLVSGEGKPPIARAEALALGGLDSSIRRKLREHPAHERAASSGEAA